ncbi:MAG TPA: response regulator [Gemmatimonadales bacterium]|nr:response regulator [Gemmatimonadales bacterium]
MTLPDELDLLLVEHDPLEAELLVRTLADSAAADRIGVARDGEEALDWLLGRGGYRHRLGSPLPRLVLLELRLPRLDAVEILRTLRASPRTATVPVVVLSSASEPRELASCYQAGANSCIRKPIEFPEFADTLRATGRYWLGLNRVAQGVTALV